MSFKVTLVLPICIKDMIPSCILAPPLAENRMNGKRCSVQYSIILHIFSPTTEPMLPILNLASITATPNSIPSKCAVPVTTASFNSVFVDLFEFFFITWKIQWIRRGHSFIKFCECTFIRNGFNSFIRC